VLQKSTELGVTRIQPLYTSRGEVKVPENKVSERLERWRRITTEAARQCGRAVAPELAAPLPLKQALVDLSQVRGVDLQLMAWEEERQNHEERALETALSSSGARRVVLLVGPEGGLSQREAQDCTLAGFLPVSLGPRVLRAETAAMVFTALVQYRLGDMA
jgi:16S rRNA (uracil1498-N3)-methyltransferase